MNRIKYVTGGIVVFILGAFALLFFSNNNKVKKEASNSQKSYEAFIIHTDRDGYLKGDLSLIVIKGKDTTFYSPYIDTVYKKDSSGRDTKVPMKDSIGRVIMSKVYYPTPDSAVKDIGNRLFPLEINKIDKKKK